MNQDETSYFVPKPEWREVMVAIELCKRHGIIPMQFDHHKHVLFMQKKMDLAEWTDMLNQDPIHKRRIAR